MPQKLRQWSKIFHDCNHCEYYVYDEDDYKTNFTCNLLDTFIAEPYKVHPSCPKRGVDLYLLKDWYKMCGVVYDGC